MTPPARDVTCAELRSRVESLPEALERTLRLVPPTMPPEIARTNHFEVTGIGASEGPARLLVELLERLDIRATFVPTVEFLRPRPSSERTLLVFSQGLSPNARLTLDQSGSYRASVLFTAIQPATPGDGAATSLYASDYLARGGLVWPHEPSHESGSLVRLVGPACALLGALRFVLALQSARGGQTPEWAAELATVPQLVRAALRRPVAPLTADPSAFLSASLPIELGRALAWKWQEALLAPLAPSFDLLSFVHGPVQSLHTHPGTFVLCTDESEPIDEDLRNRALALLEPARHRIHELRATRPGPLGWFEVDALLDVAMLHEMERRGLDPGRWPLQGRDSALYGLGR